MSRAHGYAIKLVSHALIFFHQVGNITIGNFQLLFSRLAIKTLLTTTSFDVLSRRA